MAKSPDQTDRRPPKRVEKTARSNTGVERYASKRERSGKVSNAIELDFGQVIDSIPGLACTMGPTGEIELMNRQVLDYFGKTADELKGWAISDAVHPDDLPRVIATVTHSLKTGTPYDIEHRCRRADGVYRWFQVRALPLKNSDGRIVRWHVLLIDVDDLKTVEEGLRERELHARLIDDSIPAQIFLMTPAGEIEHVNRQVQEYFGRTLAEMKKWSSNDVVHPDDLAGAIECFSKSMATGLPYEIEHRLRRFDGEYRWFHARGLPLRDNDGRMVRWYILLTDIHQKKGAEEALRTSEDNFRRIINTLPTTAWSTRPDGYCEFLSHRWLDYAGFTAEQAEGWGWGSAIHPDDAPGLIQYWQGCLASGTPVDTEARMRRFDGTYRWFLFRANPLRDENGIIVKWFGTNIDIEDRRQADEKLRRSEALLAEGQELSSTGTFSWRLDRDEMTFSEELLRIFELDRSVVVSFEMIFTRIHPEDAPTTRDRLARIRAGTASRENEMRLLMPDGRVKYLRVITRDILDSDGRPERLGAIQDITKSRTAEEELSKAKADLAHVARVTSLGVLTSSIAHEVNQPLAAIITNSETSLRWLDRPEPNIAKVRELAERVVADSRRAAEVIDRIRTMAAGRAPTKRLISLDDVVEESMVFLNHEIRSRAINVTIDSTPALPRIFGDRTQLQQVIVNLAINAAQAISQSEGTRRSILVRTTMSDPQTVCCAVEDSGPGIDIGHLPLLFGTFFTTKDSGMGMGLAISRSIVEAHGGQIRADNQSSLGGARFSFALPANGPQ